jgi:hypothetical protein
MIDVITEENEAQVRWEKLLRKHDGDASYAASVVVEMLMIAAKAGAINGEIRKIRWASAGDGEGELPTGEEQRTAVRYFEEDVIQWIEWINETPADYWECQLRLIPTEPQE